MTTTKEQGSPKVALRHWDFEKDDDSADINVFDADTRKLVNSIPGFVDGHRTSSMCLLNLPGCRNSTLPHRCPLNQITGRACCRLYVQ